MARIAAGNANELASHGYVQYKVKLKPHLPIGTQIKNTAYIYFDFNAPVVTNTTTNTVSLISSDSNVHPQTLNFSIHPNPANSTVTISVDESLVGSMLTVTDITGKQIKAVELETGNYKLETNGFPSGIYFASIRAHYQTITRKLVIVK